MEMAAHIVDIKRFKHSSIISSDKIKEYIENDIISVNKEEKNGWVGIEIEAFFIDKNDLVVFVELVQRKSVKVAIQFLKSAALNIRGKHFISTELHNFDLIFASTVEQMVREAFHKAYNSMGKKNIAILPAYLIKGGISE